MGILPKVFGPFMWATIHYICLAAPSNLSETDKNNYKNFFSILPAIMPCQACGIHLAENYNTLPINDFLSTNQDLFKWSVDLHNIVNRQLGKSEISVEDAKQTWTVNYPRLLFPNESSMSNNSDNNNKNDTSAISIVSTSRSINMDPNNISNIHSNNENRIELNFKKNSLPNPTGGMLFFSHSFLYPTVPGGCFYFPYRTRMRDGGCFSYPPPLLPYRGMLFFSLPGGCFTFPYRIFLGDAFLFPHHYYLTRGCFSFLIT
jgi:hypothetical protein